MSVFLDYRGLSRKQRLVWGLAQVAFWQALAWIYAVVVQAEYNRNPPVLDWSDKGFVKGFFVTILWYAIVPLVLNVFLSTMLTSKDNRSIAQQANQTYLYFLVGSLTNNVSEMTRFTGILRGMESFAQAVAYGLNARPLNGFVYVRKTCFFGGGSKVSVGRANEPDCGRLESTSAC
jgi:hypothetical protein